MSWCFVFLSLSSRPCTCQPGGKSQLPQSSGWWIVSLVSTFRPPGAKILNLQLTRRLPQNSCCIAASLRLYFVYQGQHLVVHSTKADRFLSATNEFIWAHIEPSCSILAACLPTYGPFFVGNPTFEKLLSGFRSFVFYPSRASGSGKNKGGTGSESGLVMDSKTSGKWPKLEISGVPDTNSVEVAGGVTTEEVDLEAQGERVALAPLQIAVKRGFGTDYRGHDSV